MHIVKIVNIVIMQEKPNFRFFQYFFFGFRHFRFSQYRCRYRFRFLNIAMSVSVSVTDSALQNKRFKDHIQPAKMQFCFLDLGNPSCKPAAWKSACENGSTNFKAVSVQAAEEGRARRHATSNPTSSGPRCPTCDGIFASEFGFRSHRRSRSRHQLQ